MKYLSLFFLIILFFSSCKDRVKEKKKTDNVFYNQAFFYQDKGLADSAFLYFSKAKDLYLRQNDSLGAGKCLINMGIISTQKGDYFGAQEISLSAISYFDKKNKDQYVYINSNFNNLGIATLNLGDYRGALKFYNSAITFATDSAQILMCLNNKARTYQELKEYQTALQIFDHVLKTRRKNTKEYAMTLTNIAFTKWLQDKNYNAVPEFLTALSIRIQEKDLLGQNSSYAHLADYYTIKQPEYAYPYALKMYEVSKQLRSPDDQREALRKLMNLSSPNETKRYYPTYQRLDDSLQVARNSAKNQFALIRYEVEKNKIDNLSLQKDNNEKSFQITKQRIFLLGTFLLMISGSIIITLWVKKRKQLVQMEAQTAIRESQLKTSKKVHDVVANGLYRVMKEVENQKTLDREGILDKLEYMYEKSRDISYEEEISLAGDDFHEKITAMLKSFATESIRVAYTGSSQDLWSYVSPQAKYEVEHILQELMVNMSKHSGGSDVALRFAQTDNSINIQYTDNGVGIHEGTKFNNGLNNTGNRIKNIDGEITFETKAEKGLKILISFPIC